METDTTATFDPKHISTIEELEVARKKAELNASHDRIRMQENLEEIKKDGPAVVLKNVVIPAAVIGVAAYGAVRLFQSLTDSDDKVYYAEPQYEYEEHGFAHPAKARPLKVKPVSRINKLVTYLPFALKAAKMGVEYLEDSGTKIPKLVHDLLDSVDGTPKK